MSNPFSVASIPLRIGIYIFTSLAFSCQHTIILPVLFYGYAFLLPLCYMAEYSEAIRVQSHSYSFSRHGALFTEPPFPADFSDDPDGSADDDLVTVPLDFGGLEKTSLE